MDLGKKYYDLDGNECTILQLIKKEPEWAANRIQAGEKENIQERLCYLLKINQDDSLFAAITGLVSADVVKGKKQSNDYDTDYFDHYFVDQQCWEDNCSGDVYYPLDDQCMTYVKIAFQC